MNLLKEALKNLDKIAEGIWTEVKSDMGVLPEEDQEIIAERRLICARCPFNSTNATNDGWYNAGIRPDEHCVMCTCNIKAKTACLSCRCGIEAHNKSNNDNLELKWYEKFRDTDGAADTA